MRPIRVQPRDTSSRLYGSSWIVGVRMSLGMNVNTTTLVKIHRHCDKRKHKDDTASIYVQLFDFFSRVDLISLRIPLSGEVINVGSTREL